MQYNCVIQTCPKTALHSVVPVLRAFCVHSSKAHVCTPQAPAGACCGRRTEDSSSEPLPTESVEPCTTRSPSFGNESSSSEMDSRFPAGIPFVAQTELWDCGIACALMALHALGISEATLDDLKRQCGTASVWTIDLAALLQRHGAKATLLTACPGVSDQYDGLPFYSGAIREDRARVERLVRHSPSSEPVLWAKEHPVVPTAPRQQALRRLLSPLLACSSAPRLPSSA